jgi:hypothetical protein
MKLALIATVLGAITPTASAAFAEDCMDWRQPLN